MRCETLESFVFQQKKAVLWFVLCLAFTLLITGCSRCDGGKTQDKTVPTVPNGIAITAVSFTEVKVFLETLGGQQGRQGV